MQPKRRAASPKPPALAPSSHTPAAKKSKTTQAAIAFPVAASASPAAACGPVDDYCPIHGQSGVHVLSADVDHMLNCTDIVAGSNSNKFYRMYDSRGPSTRFRFQHSADITPPTHHLCTICSCCDINFVFYWFSCAGNCSRPAQSFTCGRAGVASAIRSARRRRR